jgi:pyridoxine 4-dehydrogenase
LRNGENPTLNAEAYGVMDGRAVAGEGWCSADKFPSGQCVDSVLRERTIRCMEDKISKANREVTADGVTRRKFLGTTLIGGAALFAGGSKLVFAANPPAAEEKETVFRVGGDLPVNRLGFGAMRITGAGIWGWPPDRDNALKVLKRAVELGANLIDTADAYGPETSELLIAEALYPYPKDLVIATKGGNTRPGPGQWVPDGRPEYLTQCVDKSLKRLRLERIAGKIRHLGLSEVSPEEIERARKVLPIATVQNQYNIDNRKWENALTYCEKEGIGFMPWSPIGGNRGLHDNALEAAAKDYHASMVQLALAWLLHRSRVMLPIPGTSSLAHLEENMAAGKLKLTAEDWKRIDALAT